MNSFFQSKIFVFLSFSGIFLVTVAWIWFQKSAKLIGPEMGVDSSFLFTLIFSVVSFWSAVCALVFAVVFPPRYTPKNKAASLEKKIEKARADTNIPLLRQLLREKSSLDNTSGIEKEQQAVADFHAVHMNSLVLLYIPAVIYGSFSWMFSHAMLYEGVNYYGPSVGILSMLGPDILTYSFCLTAIALHVILARVSFSVFFPEAWVEELLGPDSDVFPLLNSAKALKSSDSSEVCIHEVGGKKAIFVECGKII